MQKSAATPALDQSAAMLDRHAVRRRSGVSTISTLVGASGAGVRAWRRWATLAGQRVIVTSDDHQFPRIEWLSCITEQIDLADAIIAQLAQRAGRQSDEFCAAWQCKSLSERDRFWNSIAAQKDDNLLRKILNLVDDSNPLSFARALSAFGETVVDSIVRLAKNFVWPAVLFNISSTDALARVAEVCTTWAIRFPVLPISVSVPSSTWNQYLDSSPESRSKALLREGEIEIPVVEPAVIAKSLTEVGAPPNVIAAIVESTPDATLLESAVVAIRANAARPSIPAESDGARSAAERFLFDFLESLPETAGRFELNAILDFRFGPRPAEVDLFCRSARVAIELDGRFHFISPDDYCRDRTKDWELQRRGYIVLRFLSENVLTQLDTIRDRILAAINVAHIGELS